MPSSIGGWLPPRPVGLDAARFAGAGGGGAGGAGDVPLSPLSPPLPDVSGPGVHCWSAVPPSVAPSVGCSGGGVPPLSAAAKAAEELFLRCESRDVDGKSRMGSNVPLDGEAEVVAAAQCVSNAGCPPGGDPAPSFDVCLGLVPLADSHASRRQCRRSRRRRRCRR